MTARRWNTASWLAIVLTAVGFALFVRLGFWQIDRAGQAQFILDAFDAAPHASLEDFSRVAANPPDARYPHVRISGYFTGQAYLRDEQMREGRLGVEVFGVFAGDGQGASLLVDRGWIAWSHAPGTVAPVPAAQSGETQVSGLYAPFPGNGIRVGGNRLAAQASWPKLTLAIDSEEIAADLRKPLLPRVLLLDADASSGFDRRWTPVMMPPSRHLAYAFQWFALGLAALAIFVVLHWKKVDN